MEMLAARPVSSELVNTVLKELNWKLDRLTEISAAQDEVRWADATLLINSHLAVIGQFSTLRTDGTSRPVLALPEYQALQERLSEILKRPAEPNLP